LQYLRSKCFDIFLMLWTLLLSPSLPLLWLANAGSGHVRRVSQLWANGVMYLLRTVVKLSYVEKGRENIPNGPCIVICNHQSPWETLALATLFPDASFVAKIELLKIPVVGWFLKRYPMILLDRSAGRAAARRLLAEGAGAISEGRKVIIFPQGTRCDIDEAVKFKRGATALYAHLGVPVLPIAVNSGAFWAPGGIMKYNGIVTVSYLPIIKPGLEQTEFQSRAEKMITDEVARLVEELDISAWIEAIG
jgi:1-acyl-sn-glycerol-3-phosphate acyltransferase